MPPPDADTLAPDNLETSQGVGPTAVIVHRIIKDSGNVATVQERSAVLSLTPQVKKLTRSVADLYSSAGSKKHGIFAPAQPGVPRFADSLEKYHRGDLDFIQLSLEGVHQLAEKMESIQFAKGAYGSAQRPGHSNTANRDSLGPARSHLRPRGDTNPPPRANRVCRRRPRAADRPPCQAL